MEFLGALIPNPYASPMGRRSYGAAPSAATDESGAILLNRHIELQR